jgi:hypothetical protein
MASACLRDKRLNSREEALSPFTRLTATIDWYTGSFSDRLLGRDIGRTRTKRGRQLLQALYRLRSPGLALCAPPLCPPTPGSTPHPKFADSLRHGIWWEQRRRWHSLRVFHALLPPDAPPTSKRNHGTLCGAVLARPGGASSGSVCPMPTDTVPRFGDVVPGSSGSRQSVVAYLPLS